jgi:predicted nucleotide-binding protein
MGTHKTPQLRVPIEQARDLLRQRSDMGEELRGHPINQASRLEATRREFSTWTEYNEALLLKLFDSAEIAEEYRAAHGARFVTPPGGVPFPQDLERFYDRLDRKLRAIASIATRLELWVPEAPPIAVQPSGLVAVAKSGEIATAKPIGNRVFVVHGHNGHAREATARFLERLGLEAIILHEQASGGRTIFNKLDHYGDVQFAVVLLTGDDEGRKRSTKDELLPRARQNVVFEFGYFLGRLRKSNPTGKVCALHEAGVELDLPSDLDGVVYIAFDEHGGWQMKLMKELAEAGLEVDPTRLFRR